MLRLARLALGLALREVGERAGLDVFIVANAERGRAIEDAYRKIALALRLDPAAVIAARARAKGANLRFTPASFPMRKTRP